MTDATHGATAPSTSRRGLVARCLFVAAVVGLVCSMGVASGATGSLPEPRYHSPATVISAADGANTDAVPQLRGPADGENFFQATVAVPLFPILLLGGSGFLALLALLFVQHWRRDDDGDHTQTPLTDPEKPRTDAERVAELLAENGGALKQSHIVKRTDWSKAKVSRLLSKMAERGLIEKRQDGRQNIILLRQDS